MLILLQLILIGIPLMFVVVILNDPSSIVQIFWDVRDRRARQSAQADRVQAEIERKCAIAEEAQAARRRGETYVPPADYDR
jgi:hypothetical protein